MYPHSTQLQLLAQLTQSKLNCEQRVAAFKSQKSDFESKIKELQKLEELFQTLSVGMAASEGQDNGYMDQLREAKKQGSLATSEVGQIKIRIDHLKKELAEATPKAKKAEKQNASLISEFEASKKFIDALKVPLLLPVPVNHRKSLQQNRLTLEVLISILNMRRLSLSSWKMRPM